MANLALEASNNQKNFNANQIYKETGASPNQATDKRTTTDKYAGMEGMKQLVKDTISGAEFMNQIEAAEAVKTMSADDIDFFIKYKAFILTDFKGRGVPAKVFVDYLHRLKEKQNTNAGVEFGLSDNANQALLETVASYLGTNERERLIGQAMEQFTAGTDPNPTLKRLHKLLIKSQQDWERDSLTREEIDILEAAEAQGNLNVVDVNRSLAQAGINRPTEEILQLTGNLLAIKDGGAGPGGALTAGQADDYLQKGRELLDLMTVGPEDRQLLKQAKQQVAQIKAQMNEERKLADKIAREAELKEELEAPARLRILDAQIRGFQAVPGLEQEREEEKQRRTEGREATRKSNLRKGMAKGKEQQLAIAAAEAQLAAAEKQEEEALGESAEIRQKLERDRDITDIFGNPIASKRLNQEAPADAFPGEDQEAADYYLSVNAKGQSLAEKVNSLVKKMKQHKIDKRPGFDFISNVDIDNAARQTIQNNDPEYSPFKQLLADVFYQERQRRIAGLPPPVGRGLQGRGVGGRKRSAVDRSEGYKKPAAYKQLGRYLVNHHKLRDGILMIKSPSGAAVKQLPTQSVSSHYADALHYVAGGHAPPLDLFDRLSKEEKAHFYNVIKHSRVEGTGVPNPQKEDEDKDIHRFHILKGEIIAGNDSTPLAREFKGLLIKLMRQGRIPRREGNEILEELLHLGH